MFGWFKGGTKGSKIPMVTSRGDNVKNINTMHKSGDKFIVTFERWNGHRWQSEKKEVTPSTAGFSIGDASLDISWSQV